MDEPQGTDQAKRTPGKGVGLFFEGEPADTAATGPQAPDEQTPASTGENPAVGVYSLPEGEAHDAISGGEATARTAEPVPAALPVVTVPAAEEPVMAEPPPPPAAAPPRSGGASFWPLLLSTLLGAALALLLLFLLNGSLRWPSQQDIEALQGGVTGLRQSQAQLSGDLNSVEDGLSAARSDLGALNGGLTTLNGNLAALGGELATIGTSLDSVAGEVSTQGTGLANANASIDDLQAQVQVLPVLRDELTQAQEQLGDLQTAATSLQEQLTTVTTNVDTLTERVGVVAASARRSDDFLEGMRVVLGQVYGEGARGTGVPTATLTATLAALTDGPTMTPTVVATTTIAPAATTTPTITATLAATAGPPATPTPVEDGPLSVRGVVFLDQNRNGLQDEGEPGLANTRLMVRAPDQSEQRMARSDPQGRYEFRSLPAGRYVVSQVDSSGYGSTTPNAVTVVVRGSLPAEVNFGDYILGQ